MNWIDLIWQSVQPLLTQLIDFKHYFSNCFSFLCFRNSYHNYLKANSLHKGYIIKEITASQYNQYIVFYFHMPTHVGNSDICLSVSMLNGRKSQKYSIAHVLLAITMITGIVVDLSSYFTALTFILVECYNLYHFCVIIWSLWCHYITLYARWQIYLWNSHQSQ